MAGRVKQLPGRSAVREQVSAAEWEKRVDLAACYRLLDLYGMSELSANHVSTRVPGENNAFLINPHGMLYEQMHASCFIKVDLAGDVLFNPTEYDINKAGYVVHSCIHAARHEVDCVIHTHTIAGMAVSAMECGLLPIAQTSMRFAKIAYHDYEGVALRLDEQERLVRDLGEHEGMVLRNHGLLTVGKTIAEAFNWMHRLELTARSQLAAMATGAKLCPVPQKVLEETYLNYQPQTRRPYGVMEWPALLRKLDRMDPSYKE